MKVTKPHHIATVYRTSVSVVASLSIFANVTSLLATQNFSFAPWLPRVFLLKEFVLRRAAKFIKYLRIRSRMFSRARKSFLLLFFLFQSRRPISLLVYVIDDTRTSRQVNTRGCLVNVFLAQLPSSFSRNSRHNDCNSPTPKCTSLRVPIHFTSAINDGRVPRTF